VPAILDPLRNDTFAHFHCPNQVCSAVSVIADVDHIAAKLVCSLRHVYWLPIKELARVEPYWPEKP
jgi:hypothetical protein